MTYRKRCSLSFDEKFPFVTVQFVPSWKRFIKDQDILSHLLRSLILAGFLNDICAVDSIKL